MFHIQLLDPHSVQNYKCSQGSTGNTLHIFLTVAHAFPACQDVHVYVSMLHMQLLDPHSVQTYKCCQGSTGNALHIFLTVADAFHARQDVHIYVSMFHMQLLDPHSVQTYECSQGSTGNALHIFFTVAHAFMQCILASHSLTNMPYFGPSRYRLHRCLWTYDTSKQQIVGP